MLGSGCIRTAGRHSVWWSWRPCELWRTLCAGAVPGWVGGSRGAFCVRVCCGTDEWVGPAALMLPAAKKLCCGNLYKANVLSFKNCQTKQRYKAHNIRTTYIKWIEIYAVFCCIRQASKISITTSPKTINDEGYCGCRQSLKESNCICLITTYHENNSSLN